MNLNKLKIAFSEDNEVQKSLSDKSLNSLKKEVVDTIDSVEKKVGEVEEKVIVLEQKINEVEALKLQIPEKGDKGDDYILTEDDKKEIAESIEVPVVEKLIETRTVETPIEINKIVEVAKYEDANTIVEKINTLEEVIEPKTIKGYEDTGAILKKIKDGKLIEMRDIKGMPLNMNDMRWHGGGLSSVSHDATLTGDGTPDDPLSVVGGGGSGITSINADATAAQTLTTGTSGTDFAIADNGAGDHKFNLPVASGTNTGKLSSADWTTFNSKQNALSNNTTDLLLFGDGTPQPVSDADLIYGSTEQVIYSKGVEKTSDMTFAYDVDDNLDTITYANGRIKTFTFDVDGFLTSWTDGTITKTFAYDVDDNLDTVTVT